MIRSKRSLLIAATLLVVLALAFAGYGGGGGGSNGGGNGGSGGGGGGGLLKPTAEDYKGTWKWKGNSEFPSIEFTVGPKNGEWGRVSYHEGSIQYGEYFLNITGDSSDKDLEGWIELCLD
jgi:hypothetical protein